MHTKAFEGPLQGQHLAPNLSKRGYYSYKETNKRGDLEVLSFLNFLKKGISNQLLIAKSRLHVF